VNTTLSQGQAIDNQIRQIDSEANVNGQRSAEEVVLLMHVG
jgi:hypothetical protein